MDFDFTDDQESLRDAVRRWVDKGYDFERRRTIVREGGFSQKAWGEIAELGLTGLTVPADAGGMGFGPIEAMVVMEELGRGLVLEPYAHAALVAAPLLASSAAPQASAWVQKACAGEAIVVLALQERRARYRLQDVRTRAERDGTNWVLTGTKGVVPAGTHAQAFIVPARVSGGDDDPKGIALFLVERGQGVETVGYALQDGSAAADLKLARAAAVELVGAGAGFDALSLAVDRGIAALCAEAVGAMDRLFAITVDYLNTRKQFGVQIGTFQALRHRVADMKMQLELARSMSYFASLRLADAPQVRRLALSQAKVQLGQSMRFVGQQAIQLHGGIGVRFNFIRKIINRILSVF